MQSPALYPVQSPQIPYDQLTYLQYCIMPDLFENYMKNLIRKQQFKKLGDLFVLYSQTLLQFVPYPTDLPSSRFSPLALQLIKLLKQIFRNLPIQQKHLAYNNSIGSQLYSLIIKKLIQEIDCLQTSDKNSSLVYYQSLILYFKMLELQDNVLRGKKIMNFIERQNQLKQISNFFKNLQDIRKRYIMYGKYCEKYQNLMNKLIFVFKGSQNKQKNERQQRKIGKSRDVTQQNMFKNTSIYFLYCQSISRRQKSCLILQLMKLEIKQRKNNYQSKKLRQIQLLCLIFLQQFKESKIGSKLQIYLVIIAIKICQQGSVRGIADQLKILYSFDVIPNIEYGQLILYSIINSNIDQSQNIKVKQINDMILKTYSKVHNNNDKQLIKLAIASSLYMHYKNSSTSMTIKSINRKQLLQRLIEYQDVLEFINSKQVLDFIIHLIWVGKQIKLFEKPTHRNRIERLQSKQYAYPNMFQYLCPLKQVEPQFYEYFAKFSLIHDNLNNSSNGGTNNDSLQLSSHELIQFLKILVLKQEQIIGQIDYSDYFNNKLMVLLISSDFCTRFNQQTLRMSISILQEYNNVSQYYALNDKISKLLVYVIIFSLSSSYRKEGLIGLLLIDKIPMDRVQTYVNNYKQQFRTISMQLFDCIISHDLVQLLAQFFKAIYQPMMSIWANKTQNYLYAWPESRRDKLLLAKRHRFTQYMTAKMQGQLQDNLS